MGEYELTLKRFFDNMALRKTSATVSLKLQLSYYNLFIYFFIAMQWETISACGNLAIVDYDSGNIDRYNLQSGLHRATYLRLDTEESSHLPFTRNAVRGVVSDALNQVRINYACI